MIVATRQYPLHLSQIGYSFQPDLSVRQIILEYSNSFWQNIR